MLSILHECLKALTKINKSLSKIKDSIGSKKKKENKAFHLFVGLTVDNLT